MLKKYFLMCNVIMLILLSVTSGQAFALEDKLSVTPAYFEPGLAVQTGESQAISVIVSAVSAQAAASAVEMVGGQVTSELWLIDSVAALVQPDRLPDLADMAGIYSVVANKAVEASAKKPPATPTPAPTATPTPEATPAPSEPIKSIPAAPSEPVDGWVTNFRFPVPWDGSPDVQLVGDGITVKLVYPYAIDIGMEYMNGLAGTGITVAVVDSGIDIPPLTDPTLAQVAGTYFLGQADFVNSTCAKVVTGKKVTTLGVQYPDSCFTTIANSLDPYGHGTHVAGTIWNKQLEVQTNMPVGTGSDARILSVRVLGADGSGTYETVIKGIQYVVANKAKYGIRVLNLSMSATPTTPYFIDPLDRAVEGAWAAGIVVVAAAGNSGPNVETISVPGNDPYVITVGAVDGQRTPGYWTDDRIPSWSASGPTLDGFIKPDLVAPGAQIVSYMYTSSSSTETSAYLASIHPDYKEAESLFRMNGTSMAAAVTSGAVAVLLQAHPGLTPDQVKYRLMATAKPVNMTSSGLEPNPLQQGAGRLWLPDAINAVTTEGNANEGMDLQADLAAGWGYVDEVGNIVLDYVQLSKHYLGPVRESTSDDGEFHLYYVEDEIGTRTVLGVTDVDDTIWRPAAQILENTTWTMTTLDGGTAGKVVWTNGALAWTCESLFDASGRLVWSGGALYLQNGTLTDASGNVVWTTGDLFDAAGRLVWSGGQLVWSDGSLSFGLGAGQWTASALFDSAGGLVWPAGRLVWSGGNLTDESGNMVWSGGDLFDASGRLVWSGGRLVWSGGQLVDSAKRLVWSGGRLVWSGSQMLEAAKRLVWSGGRLVWSGGRLVWSGSLGWTAPFSASAASVASTVWVDW